MAESLESEIRQLYEDWIANPSPVICARLSERLRLAGRNDEALEVARQGQAEWPSNNSVRVVTARCLRSSGDVQLSRSTFEDVLKADPFNLVALKNLAEMSLEAGHSAEAVRLFGDYLFENPGDPEAEQMLEEARRLERNAPTPLTVPQIEVPVHPAGFSAEPVEQAAGHVPEQLAAEEPLTEEPPTEEPVDEEAAPLIEAEAVSAMQEETGEPPAAVITEEPSLSGESEPASGPDAMPAGEHLPGASAADTGDDSASAGWSYGAPAAQPSAEPPLTEPGPPLEAVAQGAVDQPEEESLTAFPRTERMEKILRDQGIQPEAQPAPESHPAPAALNQEPKTARAFAVPEAKQPQNLRREPRSLFDLFSPEERSELFLEPYRQEEK